MASRLKIVQREYLLLAGLIVVIAAFFSLTTFAAHAYHRKQEQFGEGWYQRGEQALKQSRPADAVEDFRNALAYSRDNDLYRLRLAQALMADRRPQEARSYLLSLWEKQPGDGTINLELARLAAMWDDRQQAVRYYHAAIYGVWPDEPTAHRRQIRFELSEYLLRRNTIQDTKDAQAELVALVAELPPQEASGQTRLGTLLLHAGLNARALAAFRAALADQPNLMPALKGASEAAFRMGEYQTARHYLLPIVAQDPKDQSSLERLNLCELVLKLDPFARGLASREQARRALRDFQLALARAQKCAVPVTAPASQPASQTAAPQGDLSTLLAQANSRKPKLRERVLAGDPAVFEITMELTFKLEKASANCGPASLEDKALALLAQPSEAAR
ncbi:MAG TPA: tetratricopeptide repeat protein [Terriglobales bacterium]|jgi:tetratricopeptide (TPR) repeat protein|nr:tetratricopeptide repeat protein [Terriglobales bacterium]